MIRKPQTVADVIIGFTLVNSTGGNAAGEAANIAAIITGPTGTAVTGFTAPTITETGHDGNYIATFPATAANKAFTAADSANPYHVSFDSSTTGIDPTGIIEVEIGTQLVETDTVVDGLVSAIATLTTRLGTPVGASLAADIATRLATAGYTSPDNASVATILSRIVGTVALDATSAKSDAMAALLSLLGTPANGTISGDIAARKPGDFPTAITYNGSLIDTVTWYSGKVWTYHYNGSNILTGITEA